VTFVNNASNKFFGLILGLTLLFLALTWLVIDGKLRGLIERSVFRDIIREVNDGGTLGLLIFER
jgi:hypothetical protein